MTKLNIFIINYHTAKNLIQQLAAMELAPDWQVHILDNSESSSEWAQLQAYHAQHQDQIQISRASKNLGFAQGCNWLWELTEAPYVLLINPDAQLSTAGLHKLIDRMERHKKLAALAPRMYWDSEKNWWIPRATPQNPSYLLLRFCLSRLPQLWSLVWRRYYINLLDDLQEEGLLTQDFLSGAVLLLRRDAINSVTVKSHSTLFDPHFFMFFEDADLCLRLRQAGYVLGIDRTVTAQHLYQHSPHKARLMQASAEYYWSKHWPSFGPTIFSWDWDAAEQKIQKKFALSFIANSSSALERYLSHHEMYLIAWSPSPWLMPCIYRGSPPAIQSPNSVNYLSRGFTIKEWQTLEPGRYYGMLSNRNGEPGLVVIEKQTSNQ